MAPVRRFLIVANPVAGGGRVARELPSVRRELARLGLDAAVHLTGSLADVAALVEQARDEARVPVAFSGDGVVGAVAAAASRLPDPLFGVLPGGTGNDFCRHIGIPDDLTLACATLAGGTEQPVDIGEANGVRFLGIASAGFDSEANAAANRAPRWLGPAVYTWGALVALARWKPARFTVGVDGNETSFDGWSVICANTSVYGAGMFIAPDARTDDGRFDVIWTLKTGRLRFLALFPRVFKGTHVEVEFVHVERGRRVSFSSSRPFTVYADGDPITELPARIELLPAAARVLVPA
ncbi:MAG: diacylglycerol/lipid kinase family protein [Solirubrobacterales bacterium]